MPSANFVIDRRNFLAGGASLAALTAFGGPAHAASGNDIVIAMFLHGAMDSLNFVAPVDDTNYIAARPDTLRVTAAGLPLANGPTAQDWRLHPNAAPLKPLYDAGALAFVHAAGSIANSRSHFQATDLMERGITDPTQLSAAQGWLANHMRNDKVPLAAIATAAITPERLAGDGNAVGMVTPSSFRLYRPDFANFLTTAYSGTAPLAAAGSDSLGALSAFTAKIAGQNTTAAGGETALETAFDTIVSLIKWNVGLQVATVEYGSWDTHHQQATIFPKMVADLSNALAKFNSDIAGTGANVTLVAMTEFGHRVQANASGGTDHGHGSAMIVMGNAVNGGRIYGRWPGLASAQLDQGDLAITTDYRNVVGEVLVKRRAETNLAAVFPTLSQYSPLGVVRPVGA